LSDGSTLAYDNLFIGTGTSPYIPPLEGISSYQGVFSFHTLSDVKNIHTYLKEHTIDHVTIIGAGLSGIECADALVIKGLRITLIERALQILPSHADAYAAAILEERMKKAGVTTLKGVTVEKIIGDTGHISSLQCSNGRIILTQALIIVVGNRPNNSFLQGTTIALLHDRILVNEHMMTSLPHVYAGGDITVVKNILDNSLMPTTRWSDAIAQGIHAAHSMAGQEKPYPGIAPYTSSFFFNMRFAVGGSGLQPAYEDTWFVQHKNDIYQKVVFRNDVFVGFIVLGTSDTIGTLRQMLIKKARAEEVMQLYTTSSTDEILII
jgi:NAD(P)H-nitrite reductase large subunit